MSEQKKCPGSVGGYRHGHVFTQRRVKPRGPKVDICLYCDQPVSASEREAAALESASTQEVRKMLKKIAEYGPQLFGVGRFKAKKYLLNKYRVTVEIISKENRSRT